jgi:hypothetical protein
MFISELLFAVAIAFILTIIFGVIFGHRREYPGLGFFFIILLLATWAGGLWITPLGPVLWDVSWLEFLVVGVIFALLLLAVLPPERKPRTKGEAVAQAEAESEAVIVLNIFFWVMVVALIASIIIAYI